MGLYLPGRRGDGLHELYKKRLFPCDILQQDIAEPLQGFCPFGPDPERLRKFYKIRIIKANTDKELDDIIDEIYSEGYEEGKNNPDYIERDYDDIRMDLD